MVVCVRDRRGEEEWEGVRGGVRLGKGEEDTVEEMAGERDTKGEAE